MHFDHSPRVKDLQARLLAFMDEHVYPNEPRFFAEVEANKARGNGWVPTLVMEEMKAHARAAGLWNLWLPQSEHGAGLSNLEYAPLAEITGRSHISIITGTSVPCRSATLASDRTQRELTDRGDQSTTTAPAARSAASVASSKASPSRTVTSHQTSNPADSSACANRRALSRSAWV
jgi:alkylation response protein AidB-like acyl-CoA dehydrogenase